MYGKKNLLFQPAGGAYLGTVLSYFLLLLIDQPTDLTTLKSLQPRHKSDRINKQESFTFV